MGKNYVFNATEPLTAAMMNALTQDSQILQTMGESANDLMSQKAVTDQLNSVTDQLNSLFNTVVPLSPASDTSGYVLKSNGSGTAPTWDSCVATSAGLSGTYGASSRGGTGTSLAAYYTKMRIGKGSLYSIFITMGSRCNTDTWIRIRGFDYPICGAVGVGRKTSASGYTPGVIMYFEEGYNHTTAERKILDICIDENGGSTNGACGLMALVMTSDV